MLDEHVRKVLQKNGIYLNTDAGQHFLIDQDVLTDIITTADLASTDRIWEIGPGIGVLTLELLKRVEHVTAVEIDARFPPIILTEAEHSPKLTVINGNALHTPTPTDGPYKVVANIPYHITSPLLHHLLLEAPILPSSITFLIQKEVAENIASKESDSMLSVLTHLYGTPSLIRTVSPQSFLPPPKVDSAVLQIQCFEKPLTDKDTAQKILNLAKHAMSKRRKMLRNSIGELEGGLTAMEKVGINPERRPQTLFIEEWIALEATLRANRV